MCLYVWGMTRVQTGPCIHLLHEDPLGLTTRRHDTALRTAILIDTRTDNDTVNGIAVCEGLVQKFEDNGSYAFAAGVAVTTSVESVAVAIWIYHSVLWVIVVRN